MAGETATFTDAIDDANVMLANMRTELGKGTNYSPGVSAGLQAFCVGMDTLLDALKTWATYKGD